MSQPNVQREAKRCPECGYHWQNTQRYDNCPDCRVPTVVVDAEPDAKWEDQIDRANKFDRFHAYCVNREDEIAKLNALLQL